VRAAGFDRYIVITTARVSSGKNWQLQDHP
jgi:hypothetical protein